MDCLFCKIVAGEIPSNKVYEDEKILAFLDIFPSNPGHTLVVPKKHFDTIIETDDETLIAVIKTCQKIGIGVKHGLGVSGFNILQNNGRVAGQVINHLHFHIVPRHENDGHKMWAGKPYDSDSSADEIAKKIINSIT